jgi:hypothetical protein
MRKAFPKFSDKAKPAPPSAPVRPSVVGINHTFLKKLFFTERIEAQTEDTEPNSLSALRALWAWLRALWAKILINLSVRYPP